jgi:hypothetical protein
MYYDKDNRKHCQQFIADHKIFHSGYNIFSLNGSGNASIKDFSVHWLQCFEIT